MSRKDGVRLAVAKYPKAIVNEMRRISAEWAPFVDRDGDEVQALPLISWRVVEKGVKKQPSVNTRDATPTQLEQALAYHQRQALQGLRRYVKSRSKQSARNTAEHMMIANLASQLYNGTLGQPLLNNAPFPIGAEIGTVLVKT
jgi:hypothetical protein